MSNVRPIRPEPRSAAAETIDLHRALIDAIEASDETFAATVAHIRRNKNEVSDKMLADLGALHKRLVSVALTLARAL